MECVDVGDMGRMFCGSQFNGNLDRWENMGFADMSGMFNKYLGPKPWWYVDLKDKKERMEEVKRRKVVIDLKKKMIKDIDLSYKNGNKIKKVCKL